MTTIALLTTDQVADLLQVSPATARFWRSRGTGPVPLRIGGQIRYRAEDVQTWIDGLHRDAMAERQA